MIVWLLRLIQGYWFDRLVASLDKHIDTLSFAEDELDAALLRAWWTLMGVTGAKLDLIVRLQLVFRDGKLLVHKSCRGMPDLHEKIKTCFLTVFSAGVKCCSLPTWGDAIILLEVQLLYSRWRCNATTSKLWIHVITVVWLGLVSEARLVLAKADERFAQSL